MNDSFEINEINQATAAYCGIPCPRPDADLTLADILAQRIALPPGQAQSTVKTREKRNKARAERKRKAKRRKAQLRKGH